MAKRPRKVLVTATPFELVPGFILTFEDEEKCFHTKEVKSYNKETGYIAFEDGSSFFGPNLKIDWELLARVTEDETPSTD